MKFKVLVVGQRTEKIPTKKGEVDVETLVLLDYSSPAEHRLENTFDYVCNRNEFGKYPGLENKQIEIVLNRIELAFGNRLRCRGSIVTPPASQK